MILSVATILATILLWHLANGSMFNFQLPMYEHSANGDAPQSAFIIGTQKISEFIGARNLKFSANNDALYFDSKVLYGMHIGCSQIYKIPLDDNANADMLATLAPIERVERVTFGYGNAEHLAFFPDGKHFLFSGFVDDNKEENKFAHKNETSTNAGGHHNEDRCGIEGLNKLAGTEWDYPNYEEFEYLNPANDIWLADATSGQPLKRLTKEDGFDGFPTISHDSKTIFYTSMTSGNGQLWAMDVDGSNKRQITFNWDMLMLRAQLSPDGTQLLSECLLSNESTSRTHHHLKSYDFHNRTSTRICIIKLNEGKDGAGKCHEFNLINFKPRVGQSICIECLNRLTSPVFTPLALSNKSSLKQTTKLLFSAKHNKLVVRAEHEQNNVLPKGSTALYMCNVDGSELEKIVDARIKNNYPSFDKEGKRIAWISVRKIVAESFVNIKHTSHIYLGNWMGEHLLDYTDAEDGGDLIRNILQISLDRENNNNKASAIRPRSRNLNVGNGAISILYERTLPSGPSQIRRLQLAKFDFDNFIVGKFGPVSTTTQMLLRLHDVAISSPLEMASHVTRMSSSSTRATSKYGFASTSGDESMFIVFAAAASAASQSELMREANGSAIPCSNGPTIANSFVHLPADVDIYKYNALGQLLHPLVQRMGFDGEPTAFVHKESMQCRIVFTSTMRDTIDDDDDDERIDADDPPPIDANLWLLDACEQQHQPSLPNGIGLVTPRPRLLLRRKGYDGEAAFAPDGNSIVFVGSVGINNIETMAANRTTMGGKKICSPFESTSKSSLVEKIEKSEIFTINIDGTGLRQITRLAARSFAPTYMPDGKRIVFTSTFGTSGGMGSALFILNVDGTGLRRLLQSDHPDIADAYPDVVEHDTSRKFAEDDDDDQRRALCIITWSSNRHSVLRGEKESKNRLDIFLGTMQC